MISNTTLRSPTYAGNGATTTFPTTFQFLDGSDLFVQTINATSNAITTLALNTDYTVTGGGFDVSGGGSVVLNTALASGYNLIITHGEDLTQTTELLEGEAFPAQTFEERLDYITLGLHQLQDEINFAPKLPTYSTLGPITFPDGGASKEGYVLRYNAVDGTTLEAVTPSTALGSAGSPGMGTVTSVSGVSNQISVTNATSTPIVGIANTYPGQASITTLGTITVGTWQGTPIGAAYLPQDLATNASPTFLKISCTGVAGSGGTLNGQQLFLGNSTIGVGSLVLSDGNAGGFAVTIQPVSHSLTASYTFNLPSSPYAANDVLLVNSDGVTTSWGLLNLAQNVTGNLSVQNLNSGVGASSTTFLRGDGTWAVPPGTVSPDGITEGIYGALGGYVGSLKIKTVGTITTGTWNGSTIAANFGGTGNTSYTTGDILYASNSTTLSKLSGASGVLLGAVSAAPSYGLVALGSMVSGNLTVSHLNGGALASSSTFWRGDGTWATPASVTIFTQGTNSIVGAGPIGIGIIPYAGNGNYSIASEGTAGGRNVWGIGSATGGYVDGATISYMLASDLYFKHMAVEAQNPIWLPGGVGFQGKIGDVVTFAYLDFAGSYGRKTNGNNGTSNWYLVSYQTNDGTSFKTFRDNQTQQTPVIDPALVALINNKTGGVTAVTGTSNRITSTGGATPQIDISASYVGQSSITTIGTLSAGSVPLSLTTGNLPTTQLNSGTSASNSTFWRGDGVWATPAGGGGGGVTQGLLSASVSQPPIVYTLSSGMPVGQFQQVNIPTNARRVDIIAFSAGGGGGGGSRQAAATGSGSGGGGGGGSGCGIIMSLAPSSINYAPLFVSVGTGGAGGNAVTSSINTVGTVGSAGGSTIISLSPQTGDYIVTLGGGGGSGAAAAGATGGSGGAAGTQTNGPYIGLASITSIAGVAGAQGASNGNSPVPGTTTMTLISGGGAGGAGMGGGGVAGAVTLPTSTAFRTGSSIAGTASNGTGAQTATAGTTGSFQSNPFFWSFGGAGGGGAGSTTGTTGTAFGGAGGQGYFASGGGGGGAAVAPASCTSGAGGTGGDGYVRIVITI